MCVRRTSFVRYVFLILASVSSIAVARAAHAERPNGLPPGGQVIHVPADRPTIQAGVDAASDGDVVLVAGGVYTGAGIDHARIVGAGPGLPILDAESTGGGIFCLGIHDAEISNLRVTGGFAAEGGGVLCRAASPLLRGNRIDGNSAIWGGGIACTRGASPTVTGNELVENTTVNSPYFAKLGGGVFCNSGSSPRLERNVIARNSSHDYGGGVMCNAASNPSLVNDTLTANTAGTGGGLTVWNNSHPTLSNCILWNDTAFSVPEISECCGATAVAGYSDVEGGWLGSGNFAADPLFVDENLGGYHLTGTSPCIDAGDPASPPDPDASVADVGAFAFP